MDPRRTALFAPGGGGVKPAIRELEAAVYNPDVAPAKRLPLAEDTPLEVEEVQLGLWRKMTPQDKMRLVSGLCRRGNALTHEGVRRRYPDATEREVFLRAAIVRLGYDLAVAAFPDAAGLAP